MSANILFNFKINPTMNVIRTLLVNKTKAEIEKFTLDYFRFNGYYNLTVKKGMKFSTYSSRSEPLSPKRLNRDIMINFFDNPQGGQKVVTEFSTLKMGGYGPKTALDKEYYEDFMQHFEKALQAGVVEKFEDESYVKRAKIYTKPFYIVSALGIALYLILQIVLDFDVDTGLMLMLLLGSQSLGIWYANWKVEKEKSEV